MKHLLERFRDGRIAVEDFAELKHWLESDVEVPEGPWFKRFAHFTLAGEGEMPKTFLTSRMAPKGTEVS
jgi:hypothetical protein